MVVSVAVEKTSFYFDKLYDYEVSDELALSVEVGCLVAVPFGKNNDVRQAVVFKKSMTSQANCKFILEVLSKKPVISLQMLRVVKHLHSTCFCSWFEALKAVLPSGVFFKIQRVWSFRFVDGFNFNEQEQVLIFELKKLKKLGKAGKINEYIKKILADGTKEGRLLKKKGLIFESVVYKQKVSFKKKEKVAVKKSNGFNHVLTAKQQLLFDFILKFGPVYSKEACYRCGVSRFVLKKLESMNLVDFVDDDDEFECEEVSQTSNFDVKSSVVLSESQQQVADGLITLLSKNEPKIALLRGVTGSGKTQVFLKLIEWVVKHGKQVILLVPEIALTPQMVRFFKLVFKNMVAVLNSSLTLAQQFNEHEKIKANLAKLVIGTRSAVFAPCANLGLIIMDEEGEPTYKNSDMSPRYHARDVAKFRCFESKSLLLLASATPSIETQYFAKTGRYFEFVLNKRFGNAKLPKVVVVDLKKASGSPINGISSIFYNELVKNLSNKEQSIVLLNKRGYNSSVVCLSCGYKASCPNCSAVLTYHSVNNSLMCHYCGHIQQVVKVCKNCLSSNLTYFGQGTQKIEQALIKEFSSAKILRLDSDAVYSREDLENKIKDFENCKYDILIGTQIVAKGLNFVNVTLVGVLSIDNMLFGSDFRNSERVFSLLTQVVGRSGRGSKVGRAIIQTYNPASSVILKAASQNYEDFYSEEIVERRQFLCPPFCDLCIVNFSSVNESKIQVCAHEFTLQCKKQAVVNVPIQVLGVATPFIEKVNKRYRNRVIIKCRNNVSFRSWMRNVASVAFSSKNFAGVRVNIDINGEIL